MYNGNHRYYRLLKGGIREYYDKKSNRKNKFRTKPERIHFNHPKEWVYGDNGYAERGRYGGTSSKSYLKPIGYVQNKVEVRYG
jgi:hypothetical protein